MTALVFGQGQHLRVHNTPAPAPRAGKAGEAVGGWHSLPLSWRSAAASLEVTICITVRAESLEYLHLQLLSPEPLPHPILSLPGIVVGTGGVKLQIFSAHGRVIG